MYNARFIGILLGFIALLGAVLGLCFGMAEMASFELGFIGFLVIVGSSFAGLLKRVKPHNTIETDIQTESMKSTEFAPSNTKFQKHEGDMRFSSRFILGTHLSFSLLRIVSYIFFVALLMICLHYHLFTLMWFFIGLGVALVALIVFVLRFLIHSSH